MYWYDSRRRRNRERFREWEARGLDAATLAIPIQAIRELQASIQGSVLLPGDKGYEEATHLANARFHFHPEVIVFCESMTDVADCLTVIEQCGIEFSIRSGGHNTAGYSGSNVMMVDVSRLDGIQVDAVNKVATVGPGCNWGAFNKATRRSDFTPRVAPAPTYVRAGTCRAAATDSRRAYSG